MSFFTKAQIQEVAKIIEDKEQLKPDCLKCGLHKKASSHKLEPHGKGKKKILIINSKTSKSDDMYGVPGTNDGMKYFSEKLEEHGIDTKRDTWRINAISCYEDWPTQKHIKCCSPYVHYIIHKLKPKTIILIGQEPLESLYFKDFKDVSVGQFRGLCIPDQKFNFLENHRRYPS